MFCTLKTLNLWEGSTCNISFNKSFASNSSKIHQHKRLNTISGWMSRIKYIVISRTWIKTWAFKYNIFVLKAFIDIWPYLLKESCSKKTLLSK